MVTRGLVYFLVVTLCIGTGWAWAGSETGVNTLYGNGAGTNLGDNDDQATFIGYQAGYNATDGIGSEGKYNTFVGYRSGYVNSTGYYNTFIGREAGYDNDTGHFNTFLGSSAGRSNDTGSSNTFLGYLAGFANTSGQFNTFLGGCGYSNISGHRNVCIGEDAGAANSIGSGNVFLGYQAGFNETGSDRLYIDNSSIDTPLIYGEFDNEILTIHGKVGINTKTPGYAFELVKSGSNAALVARRTDGATNFMNATASYAQFGAVTNHPVRILVNSTWRMVINGDSSINMVNGAGLTAGGTWTDASSREYKEDIEALTTEEALDTFKGLNPVKFAYKRDPSEKHVGFIAEEVPDLIATKDRKGLSPMDIVAVLTKVVQEQQETINELSKEMKELKRVLRSRDTVTSVDSPREVFVE